MNLFYKVKGILEDENTLYIFLDIINNFESFLSWKELHCDYPIPYNVVDCGVELSFVLRIQKENELVCYR